MSVEIGKTQKQGDALKGKAYGKGMAAAHKPQSEAVKKERLRILRIRLEQQNTQISTIVVGIIVNIILIGIGISMFILGGIFSNTDFYIVGSIFLVGAVIFAVVFTVANCTPWIRDRRTHAQLDREVKELEGQTEAPTVLAPGQYNHHRVITR